MKCSITNVTIGDFRKPRTAVGTHSHLVRNIDAGDDVALANLIAWSRATGVGAVGLGSPWTHLSGLAYRRCEGPDRDRYFAGLIDPESLLFRDDIAAMLKRANAAAEGKTFFYLDNETPKNRYGHLWYVGFDYQVPAWHDYSQDHRVQFCDTDPVEDPNPLAPGGAHRRRTYMEVIARQRKAGALAVWAHPTSWWTNPDGSFVTNIAADLVPELLADGYLDGMTVQGYDAYHHDYQALWFHLLDKGYRIPGFSELDLSPAHGTGGKGHALFNYIEGLDRPPTMDEMKDAFRNARHTMSSGPYLTICVDGQPSGTALVSDTGMTHRVSVTAFPSPDEAALAKVEIIGRGGEILATVDDFTGGVIDFDVEGDAAGGYILARAFGEKDGDYAAKPQQKVRHCALTNPVWLQTPDFVPPAPVQTRVTLIPSDAAGARLRILAADGDTLDTSTIPSEPTTLTLPASARIEIRRDDGRVREIPISMANAKVRALMDYLADGHFRSDTLDLKPGEVPVKAFKFDEMREAISQITLIC